MNSTVILLVSWRNALFLPLKHYLIQCQWRAHLNVEQMMNILFEIEAVFVDPLKSSNSCSSFTQSLFEKGKTCLLILGATNRKNLFTGQDFFFYCCLFFQHYIQGSDLIWKVMADCLPGELFHCFILQEFFWDFQDLFIPVISKFISTYCLLHR